MKIDELALEEASAKLLRLRLTDVGGRKERPSETVKSVLKRGLGGMYDDQAVMYILRHGLQYYQSAQQPRAADKCPEGGSHGWVPTVIAGYKETCTKCGACR